MKNGADVNVRNSDAQTPLILAANRGDKKNGSDLA